MNLEKSIIKDIGKIREEEENKIYQMLDDMVARNKKFEDMSEDEKHELLIQLNKTERNLRQQALQRHPELSETDFFDEASLDEEEAHYKEMKERMESFKEWEKSYKKERIKYRITALFLHFAIWGSLLICLLKIFFIFF